MSFFFPGSEITRFTEVVYSQAGHYRSRAWLAFGPFEAEQTQRHLDALQLPYTAQSFADQPLFNFDFGDKDQPRLHLEALTAREMRFFLNHERTRLFPEDDHGALSIEEVRAFFRGLSPLRWIRHARGHATVSCVYTPARP